MNNFRSTAKVERILGMRIDLSSYYAATKTVLRWAREGRSAMVCLGNVHMVMTAYDEREFAQAIESADLVTHDGMPLVWTLRLQGHDSIERVYGPHLMSFVCQAASSRGIPIGLYGGTPEVLKDLVRSLEEKYPGLQIPFAKSPPFRPATKEEDDADLKALRDSGARILFVGIGCPKQEFWIHRNRRRFPGPMLGVGQAFDIHSGHTRMAPRIIQNIGMEWFYRLCTEPRRLWRRYLKNNPRYVALVSMQLFDRFVSRDGRIRESPLVRRLREIISPHLRRENPSRGRKR